MTERLAMARLGLAAWILLPAVLLVPWQSPASQEVRATPTVRVGVYENSPKIAMAETGRPEGIFIDLIERIAELEGWTIEYRAGTWSQCLDRLAAGEIDLMPDVAYSREREQTYSFHAEPALSDWFQLYARRGSSIRSLLDLDGKTITILERSIQQDVLEKALFGFNLKIHLKPMPDYESAFAAAARGDADAVIANRFYGARHARAHQLEDTAIILNPTRLFFAAPLQGDRKLLDAIDRRLREFKQDPSSVYFRSIRRWTSEEIGPRIPAWIKTSGYAALTLLAVAILWSVSLRRMVSQRTRQLKLRNDEHEATHAQMNLIAKALRENEKKYRTLFENAGDAIILMRNERFVECNARALVMFGCRMEDIIGHSPYEFSPPRQPDNRDSREKALEKIRLASETGPQFFEWTHCRLDKTPFPAEVGLTRLDLNGEILIQAIVRDTTARKAAEDALRKSESTIRGVFRAAPVGICIMKDRHYVSANRFWCETFGYSEEEIVGKSTRMLYESQEEFERVGRELYAGLGAKGLASTETRLRCADGSFRQVLVIAAPLQAGDPGNGTVVIIHDITAIREAEAQIRRLNDDLRRHAESLERRVAERTAELAVALDHAEESDRLKSAFLATMSHELRTPLNSIIGFTGILLMKLVGPLTPEQEKQLNMVEDSAKHLLDMINDVLDISKIEAGQIELVCEPFDLSEAIRKSVEKIAPLAAKKRLPLNVAIAPGLERVVGDRRRAEQVVINLLSNAVKFTERGEVRIEAAAKNGCAVTRVCDTGIGIKTEHMDALFKPFRQIESGITRQYEGTGLGLSICKRLIEAMHGSIEAESEYGRGSVFSFTLPLEGESS